VTIPVTDRLVYDIQNLVKVYPGQKQPANRNITLKIHEAEIFGLLGDNGAGKTTLIRQMANLVHSSSGQITLYGKPLTHDVFYVPLHIGYMPQGRAALGSVTLGEALYFTGHLRGLSRQDAKRERDRLIELWQLGGIQHQPADRLSDGEVRLMMLATALVGSPPVLLLDEPTNDLAPQRRQQVWRMLRELNQDRRTTIVFITHDALEAEKIIQRVGVMWCGELVALGRPGELKQQLGKQLRLELFFDPSERPRLPADLSFHELDKGRWLAYIQRSALQDTLNQIDLSQFDDFRLYSVTLEDLYLHYAETATLSNSAR
jgi:ABC-type multidrug transport system ATPase subunit